MCFPFFSSGQIIVLSFDRATRARVASASYILAIVAECSCRCFIYLLLLPSALAGASYTCYCGGLLLQVLHKLAIVAECTCRRFIYLLLWRSALAGASYTCYCGRVLLWQSALVALVAECSCNCFIYILSILSLLIYNLYDHSFSYFPLQLFLVNVKKHLLKSADLLALNTGFEHESVT